MERQAAVMTVWLIASAPRRRSYILVFAGPWWGGFSCSGGGAPGIGTLDVDRIKMKIAGGRGHLAKVPGSATLAHTGHPADGRIPLVQAMENGGGFLEHAI